MPDMPDAGCQIPAGLSKIIEDQSRIPRPWEMFTPEVGGWEPAERSQLDRIEDKLDRVLGLPTSGGIYVPTPEEVARYG
jgi:hypothetical protein